MTTATTTPRSIDRRLGPPPRDYLAVPEQFGTVADPETATPNSGSERVAPFALFLHRLMVDYRNLAPRGDQAAIARRHGLSRSTVSDVVAGKRWPNVTVLLAISLRVAELHHQRRAHHELPSADKVGPTATPQRR
ncbi:helix-turn-helix protein [Ilumatobacter fluminis]|uniref:Helix-turn-helix protein n=1 Tax=Ilumatobacter fluminis TaxID=467091 RepID=A0A4R7HUY6_9ACTN|nr:helix-turn-helix transcriptional regulator [Ilumatobacter fluminis]TDT14777.1 helix-turn-helix protein [Ilumatobacter fluminis]